MMPGDYKPRRSPPPPTGPRKIPLFRIALLIAIVVYSHSHWSHLKSSMQVVFPTVQRTWEEWVQRSDSGVPSGLTRKEQLSFAGGKSFRLRQGYLQESWRIQNAERLRTVLSLYNDSLCVTLIRTLVEIRGGGVFASGVLDIVFRDSAESLPLLARFRDSLGVVSILKYPYESGYVYINADTHCEWLEECPMEPLQGAAVSIDADFDFTGREHLLTHDLFRGIGESPVVAVLPGVVTRAEMDSKLGGLVEIVHPNNEMTRSMGLAAIADGIKPGTKVEQGQPVGKLSARDTAELVFQLLRNGRFIRWEEFRKESHPANDSLFATFQQSLFE